MVLDNTGWDLNGRVYRKTVSEGFLLGEGYLTLDKFLLPALQLMKVHPGHPIEVIYNGSPLIRPEGDKRLVGEIRRDPNQKVIYDGISLFLCPPEYRLPDKNKMRGLPEYPYCFEYIVGYTSSGVGKLSIGYAESTEIPIGDMGIASIVEVAPPFIPRSVLRWLLSEPTIKMRKSEDFETLGVSRLRASAAHEISRRLEERFETQMFQR